MLHPLILIPDDVGAQRISFLQPNIHSFYPVHADDDERQQQQTTKSNMNADITKIFLELSEIYKVVESDFEMLPHVNPIQQQ